MPIMLRCFIAVVVLVFVACWAYVIAGVAREKAAAKAAAAERAARALQKAAVAECRAAERAAAAAARQSKAAAKAAKAAKTPAAPIAPIVPAIVPDAAPAVSAAVDAVPAKVDAADVQANTPIVPDAPAIVPDAAPAVSAAVPAFSIPAAGNGAFCGQIVAFTGSVPGMHRDACIAAVRRNGGKAFKSMPAGTTMLVVGTQRKGVETTDKLEKADQWCSQVTKITAARFLELVNLPIDLTPEQFDAYTLTLPADICPAVNAA